MVFSTEWFSIERENFDDVRNLDGRPFYRFKAPDSVMMLATTPSNQVILVRQFRLSIMQHTLELPAGYIDGGETAGEAAARELYEETGFRCETIESLGPGRIMMNRTDSVHHGFFGQKAVLDPEFRPREDIEVVTVSPGRLKELIVNGDFQQLAAMALIALAGWKLDNDVIGELSG